MATRGTMPAIDPPNGVAVGNVPIAILVGSRMTLHLGDAECRCATCDGIGGQQDRPPTSPLACAPFRLRRGGCCGQHLGPATRHRRLVAEDAAIEVAPRKWVGRFCSRAARLMLPCPGQCHRCMRVHVEPTRRLLDDGQRHRDGPRRGHGGPGCVASTAGGPGGLTRAAGASGMVSGGLGGPGCFVCDASGPGELA